MSEAFQRFLKTRVYENTATAEEILADLQSIRSLDKQKESETMKFGCGGALLIPLALVGMLFGESQPLLAGIWVVSLLAVAIVAIVFAVKAHHYDVEDRRYEMMHSVMDLLRRDIAADTPVAVMLSLKPVATRENFQTKGKVGVWDFKLYHDDWMRVEAKLLDGTLCRVELTERHQQRSRWKTSASGKSKHKSKTKSCLAANVRLKPKTHRYTKLSEIGQQAAGAVQLPPWAALKGIAVEDGGLAIKAFTKTEWNAPSLGKSSDTPHGIHLVAMMLLSLYQVLNLSRVITKAERDAE